MSLKPRQTNLPLGYLRAFIIVVVVMHHSMLAYYTQAPYPVKSMLDNPRWWMAFAVVDTTRWRGFTPLVLFDDSYTMALLFLISGLFSWGSLKRKKVPAFLRDRLLRLGLPLLLMSAVAPLAYYTVYLQGHLQDGFWHEWLQLHSWPAGSSWFLAVLLCFDLVAIVLKALVPRAVEGIGSRLVRIQSPLAMVLVVAFFSSLFYLPPLVRFGPYYAGAFFIPVSRLFHDVCYFLLGLALGSASADPAVKAGLIAARGRLAANWLPFLAATVGGFLCWQFVVHVSHYHHDSVAWEITAGIAFCLSCSISVFAALSFFLHFVRRPRPLFDSMLACSFGIFIFHYLIVAWLLLAFVGVAAPGWIKAPIVFLITYSLAWGITALVRRSTLVARLI